MSDPVAAAGGTLQFSQRLTRWQSLGIALRRWPYSWAERQWGYGPSWWLRLLSLFPVAWQVLRSRAPFPIEQTLRFDAQGVDIRGTIGQRRMGWKQFSGWIDLGNSWMLTAPGVDIPVLFRQFPVDQAEKLRALLLVHLTLVEAPRH